MVSFHFIERVELRERSLLLLVVDGSSAIELNTLDFMSVVE